MPKYRPQTVATPTPSTPSPDGLASKAEVAALQTKIQKLIADHPENAQKAAQIIHEWLAAESSPKR
jgi:hypothetical protein